MKRSMSKVIVVCMALTGITSTVYAQDQDRCKAIRQNMAEKGLQVDITFQATELFDATQVINYRRMIKVEPNVGLRRPGDSGPILTMGCSSWGKVDGSVMYYGFHIGKDARLNLDGQKLAAAIPGNVWFITEVKYRNRPWTNALRFSEGDDANVEIYHAIAAELMRGFEFDTWESAGASNYSKLLQLPYNDLPSRTMGGNVLGIAGREGKLYQVAVGNYSMNLVP